MSPRTLPARAVAGPLARRLGLTVLATGLATGLAAASIAALPGGSAVAEPRAARTAPQGTVTPYGEPRGADTDVATLVEGDLWSGGTRTAVPGRALWLVGPAGGGYVVLTYRPAEQAAHLVRVVPGAAAVDLGRISDSADPRVASDGSVVVTTRYQNRRRSTVVRVLDPTDGSRLAGRRVPGYATALDGDATHAVLGGSDLRTGAGRTLDWTYGVGVRQVAAQMGIEADLGTDTLALLTKDPYQGGCTRVATLSTPATTVWRSCTDVVTAIAPDGRLVTTDLLADGLGPGRLVLRTPRGRALTDYRSARNGVVDVAGFEPSGAFVIRATGPRTSALVRCTGTDCEQASPRFTSSN